MSYQKELDVAVRAVRAAARLTEAVRQSLLAGDSLQKGDRSPVTVADFGAQAVVARILQSELPEIPIVGEETADELREPSGEALRARVVERVQAIRAELSESSVLEQIDSCSDPGGREGLRWALDPIDGTKGYLRGQHYAIALGLLDGGRVVAGVLGCPYLEPDRLGSAGPRGRLFFASEGDGCFEAPLEGSAAPQRVRVATTQSPAEASFCESVESAHSAHSTHARIADALGVTAEPVRIDSQCKYGVLARGEAAIYLRLPTSETYREKIWDHAAGACVLREAGGRVTDIHGKELDFTLGRRLKQNRGIVASNGTLHDRVLRAVAGALESS